jgi:hypothetical protein
LDCQFGINDGGERECPHRGCLKEAVEFRGERLIQRIHSFWTNMEPVALRSIPEAGITLKDVNVNVVLTKRLCET